MKHLFQFVFSIGFIALSAFAARPVATLTSAEPFSLDGHSMNTPGVTTFPVVVGDTVATSRGTAILHFTDGSTLKLGANSSVRIAGADVQPRVVLLSGALDYKLIPGTALSVTNLDTEAKLAPQMRPTVRAAVPVMFARNQPALPPAQSVKTATASYAGADTETLGTWTGRYGADGVFIPTQVSNAPAYATVSFIGNATSVTEANSKDPRSLQTSSGGTSRIVSQYSNNFTIDLNLTDGYTHRVALYLVDFAKSNVAETITIVDAQTKEILATQPVTAFSGGVYEVWNLMGHVQIHVTSTNGGTAVVNGIFFDPPGALPTGNEPPANPGSTGASTAPNASNGILTNPKFLVPLAGAAAAGLAIGLLSLPPASTHF